MTWIWIVNRTAYCPFLQAPCTVQSNKCYQHSNYNILAVTLLLAMYNNTALPEMCSYPRASYTTWSRGSLQDFFSHLGLLNWFLLTFAHMPHPMHNSSEMNAILSTGVTSMHNLPKH